MPYRNRGYLPHLTLPDSTYFVTFRLADTLPQNLLREFTAEKSSLIKIGTRNQKISAQQFMRLKYLKSTRIQNHLDKGIGDCWLNKPAIAEIVKGSILHFDGTRYVSHVFCIMLNHVHWLLSPKADKEAISIDSILISIMHSVKSFTAHEANKVLGRSGRFWSKEYYDHLVRSSEQFGRLLVYTLENPVKAGLCNHWRDWPWTVCSEKIRSALTFEGTETKKKSPPEAGVTKCKR